MIKFGKEKVMLLHRLLIEETGGKALCGARLQPCLCRRKQAHRRICAFDLP